jgi:hypothetical protein
VEGSIISALRHVILLSSSHNHPRQADNGFRLVCESLTCAGSLAVFVFVFVLFVDWTRMFNTNSAEGIIIRRVRHAILLSSSHTHPRIAELGLPGIFEPILRAGFSACLDDVFGGLIWFDMV